ncbi:hypothetical protein ACHAXT_000542 [Thalassiosira profunda]
MPPDGGAQASTNDENLAVNAWKGTGDPELRIDLTKREEHDVRVKKAPARVRAKAAPNPAQTEGDSAEDYVPRWARSSKPNSDGGDDDDDLSASEDAFSPTAELPPFADEESKALHREIKLLEQRRDAAASSTRSHKERIGIINDHLSSIRQEIDHTNSLVAAKKNEVDAEEHLLSLSQRELGQSVRDASGIDSGAVTAQKSINSVQSQIKAAEDDLEKLRTDLNWNQEELEQWATAASKKEEESLALQKYALADELKIKELALTIEDLTKMSVEKKTLLENEVTETKSNQTELEKLADRFKSRHDERRQLIQQWKDTIESMNDRDQAINELAGQYAGYAEKEDETKRSLYLNRNQFKLLENERDDSRQEVDDKERYLQAKRQDLSSIQGNEQSLKDEVGSIQRENAMVAAAVSNRTAERKRAQDGLEQKKEHAVELAKQLGDAKGKLASQKLDTSSKERLAESIEKTLASREKELVQAEKNITSLKNKMYKDSQRLAGLRKQEADLIADIHGAQANIRNFSSKANELETKRTRQQELLYNADFQLQQMEKKIARGLGERSNEEQDKLQSQIETLEVDLEAERQKKLLLVQQQRKLHAELRAWKRKHEASGSKHAETVQRIEDIGLEIFACEQSLKEMVAKKDEALVSHDVTLLDVRRLRDSLRSLLEEVFSMKQRHADTSASMQDKKDEKSSANDAKSAQLRASKEERHKSAVQLGKLKVAVDKTKSKYDMISGINASKGEGEGYESPELKLILAAQKRAELLQEGDALDETIVRKEKEVKSMKKTLSQLKQRNSSFRSSFTRADMNGAQAQHLRELEMKAQSAEDALVKVRNELKVLEGSRKGDQDTLDRLTGEARLATKVETKSSAMEGGVRKS